ncbi:hypothetical protein LWI28_019183 [Acer negundo]|uniref:Reverse transcriptase n=1 Tax=Acer negundo TaxID=4023 RepID=A0AAD5NHS6_ACENE|nr:hypothetical protein LWI28_019183 [Acer negundo]
MEEFNDCPYVSELDDLRFSGFFHTWCNKRSIGCISKKLDRVLVNKECMAKFEHSEAIFLPPSISDHSPSLVKLGLQGNKKNCPFKFFNFLTEKEDFLPLVESCWQENFHGSMQFQLCSKLRNLKKVLKSLNKHTMGDLMVKSIEAKASLVDCQILLDLQPLDEGLRIQEKELMSSYTRFFLGIFRGWASSYGWLLKVGFLPWTVFSTTILKLLLPVSFAILKTKLMPTFSFSVCIAKPFGLNS